MRRIRRTIKGIAKIIHEIVTRTISGFGSVSLTEAIANELDYVKVFGGCEQDMLPAEYQQVEYLQSSGTQYINTGIRGPAKVRIDAQGNATTNASQIVIGTYTYPPSFRGQAGSTQKWGLDSQGTISYDTRVQAVIDFKDEATVEYNDGTSATYPGGYDFYDSANYALFRAMARSSTNYYYASAKIFSCSFEQNGEIVADLVPARRKSDSVLGFYDKVRGSFLTNAGSGTFTAGPDINIIPIKCNNGEIQVFCGDKFTRSGQTTGQIINTDGSISSNSSYNITAEIPLKKGGYTLTFKDTVISSGRIIRAYTYDNPNRPVRIFNTSTTQTSLITYPFNVPYDCNVRVCYRTSMSNITISPTDPIITTDGDTETIEDSLGNTATAEMLLGVTGLSNIQEILTGEITRNIAIKVFTSADVVEYQSTNSRFVLLAGVDMSYGNRKTPLYCTHFATIDDGRSLSNVPDKSIYGASTTTYLYIHYSNYTTKASFGAWLDAQYEAGTPVVAVYPLQTPTTESAEGQELNIKDRNNIIAITQAGIDTSKLELEVQYEALEIHY